MKDEKNYDTQRINAREELKEGRREEMVTWGYCRLSSTKSCVHLAQYDTAAMFCNVMSNAIRHLNMGEFINFLRINDCYRTFLHLSQQ